MSGDPITVSKPPGAGNKRSEQGEQGASSPKATPWTQKRRRGADGVRSNGRRSGVVKDGSYTLHVHFQAIRDRPLRCICSRCGELVAEGSLDETRAPWKAHRRRCRR